MSPATLEEVDETTAVAEPSQAKWVPQQYYDPNFKTAIIGQLEALGELSPGWDGYNALSPSVEIVHAAVMFVRSLSDHIAPRPRVVPLVSGALQLEWADGERVLELEFESPTTIHYLRWDPQATVSDETDLPVESVSQVEGLIKWFTRRNA
jgi:hypothetical protein